LCVGMVLKILTKRMMHKRLTFRVHRRNSGPFGAWLRGKLIHHKGWGCARKLSVAREVHDESSFIVLSLKSFLARLVL